MSKPYVILIGSASGIGKSTISAELAKSLGIKHLIESDFIREVVRGIIGKDYAPTLHSSSYTAYTELRNKNNYNNEEELISAGFVDHASFVVPALEKVIDRAIKDYDDVIIEGVHLIPGLIDIDKFKERADVHFFILTSDENSHKNRFVKRATEKRRGGKQLDYFKENRIIHDFLIKEAKKNNVKIIESENINTTIHRILGNINKTCKKIYLNNTVDELEAMMNIIVKENNGNVDSIFYNLSGFKEPLIRNVNIYDSNETDKFINIIKNNESKREELDKLYKLSTRRGMRICAPDAQTINKICKTLEDEGFKIKGE